MASNKVSSSSRSSNSGSFAFSAGAFSVAVLLSFGADVEQGVFCVEAWLLEVAGIFGLLVLLSVSDPEEFDASDFFGQVRALCPGSPHMLHFLDIVQILDNWLGVEIEILIKT